MKLSENFVLKNIAGENVVLPSGDDLDLSVMISLNDTAKFLWEQLQEDKTEEDLLQAVIANYEDVDQEEAKKFISEFVSSLKEHDFLA